ncbi:MAG: polysaccharide deacetylase family protein [Myxococcaceae bacterium]
MNDARSRLPFLSTLIALAVTACGGRPVDGSATPTPQPPINVTFDLHSDPEPQNLSLDERRAYFRRQLDNARWLLDTVEPYGARISFLAVGEFYEFCVEASERDTCLPLLRRLQASGAILGTHHHANRWRGSHDWPLVATGDAAGVQQVWDTNKRFTDEAVRQALGLSDPAEVSKVNAACESHVPGDETQKLSLMTSHGYTIREGGGDQDLVPLFGHVPWNPFRPGKTALTEDFTTSFVTVPQGMVIGHNEPHKNVMQDGRVPRKKAELLELYVNWLDAERTGAAPRVWSFGWGVHTQDLDAGSQSRDAIAELVPWLHDRMAARASPAGNPQLRFGSYVDVRDEYLAWESAHPGVSSFTYPLATRDYAAYPYLEWANRYLASTNFEAELDAPAGIQLFRLSAGGHALVLAAAGEASGTVDVSALAAGTLRKVELATGKAADVDAASATVGPGSAILCAPAECEALLALGQAPAGSACATACGTGTVCCEQPFGCAGKCVPDCRVAGNACPAQAPTCNASAGICAP